MDPIPRYLALEVNSLDLTLFIGNGLWKVFLLLVYYEKFRKILGGTKERISVGSKSYFIRIDVGYGRVLFHPGSESALRVVVVRRR